MQGVIIKGIGGLYFVKTEQEIIECKARGKFRYNGLTPMIGDRVEILQEGNKGVIERIFERSTELIRPVVANVTQAFVVFTLKQPDLNLDLLNRFLVLCEYNKLKVVVAFNKMDLIKQEDQEDIDIIKQAGYEVVFVKAKEGFGFDLLQERIRDNITVFCGPSGVGKSTILNGLVGREVMLTGEISEKLKRGKHTTRHSELIEFSGGFLVDTPGFSSLTLDFIEKEELQFCFPEFEAYRQGCRFNNCMHHKEPNCQVKAAVDNKEIHLERYTFYIKTLGEIINRRNKR